MDIENEKISARQLGRMLFYDFFALTSLLLPGILTKEFGRSGFFSLIAGYLGGYLFLRMILAQMRKMMEKNQSFDNYLQHYFGKILTRAGLLYLLLFAGIGGAYGLYLLCDITRQYLIRDTPVWLIVGVLAVLLIYGVSAGIESRGRMMELLFWLFLLPIIALFLLAVWNVEPARWMPLVSKEGISVNKWLSKSYLVFAFFLNLTYLPVLTENLHLSSNISQACRKSYVLCAGLNVILFLLLTGIFGAPTVAQMEEAALTLTAMVKVPGGFLERQDALLCGIWFVSVFLFVENAMYASVWCAKRITGRNAHGYYVFGAGICVGILAVLMYANAWMREYLVRWYLAIGVPVMLLLAVVVTLWPLMKEMGNKEGLQ